MCVLTGVSFQLMLMLQIGAGGAMPRDVTGESRASASRGGERDERTGEDRRSAIKAEK